MRHLLKIVVFILVIAYSSVGHGQLVVNNNAPYDDPTYLVQNVMLNIGLVVTNVTFNGQALPTGASADMIGYFNGSGSNLSIAEGVLINTGRIIDAPGPNNSGSDGWDAGRGGDADLNLLSGVTTYDAAILEFDFETVTDGISFRYVFASEEYNEYVCSGYNDVFGFFVSGPGVSGPFSNGAKNIATVPSTSTYVAINTVNNGTVGWAGIPTGCGGIGDPGLNNTAYYVDNEALGQQSIQYDGFTTVLTAQEMLIPCTVYHMKIAIADAGDHIYDSGVFLEAASFGAVGIQVEVGQVGASVASVVEGCDSLLLIFSRAGPTTGPLTINYNVSGSATNGVDYDYLPGSVVIPTDSSSVQFNIGAFLDGLPEGIETITITIPADLTNTTCLDDVPSVATITIVNTDPLELQAIDDTTICPGETAQLNTNVSGGIPGYSYTWTPATNLSCTTCPNPIASPSVVTTYSVQVTDNCGTDVLTEDLTINVGGLTLEATNNVMMGVEGCSDASFTFIRYGPTTNAQTINFTVTGTATNGVDYAFIANSIIIPAGQNSYVLVLDPFLDSLMEANESVTITTIPDTSSVYCSSSTPISTTLFIMNVEDIAVVASNDTVMCGGVATTIYGIGSGGVPPRITTWYLGPDSVGSGPSLNIQPDENMTYTVVVSDTCGNPVATEMVNIIVTTPPPSMTAIKDTAYEGCRDALFTVSRTDTSTGPLTIYYTITGTATNGGDYSAIVDSVLIPAGENSVDISVLAQSDLDSEGDETIILSIPRDSTDTICYVIPASDTVYIRNVDPLAIDVPTETICPGDLATLTAVPTGGVGQYTYSWSTGDTLISAEVSPTDSSVYSVMVLDTCGQNAVDLNALVAVRSVLGSVANAGVTAYEGCKGTSFTFSIPTELPADYTIYFTVAGTATSGVDYDPLPSSIVIPADSLSVELDVTTLLDGSMEGLEDIVITIDPGLGAIPDTAFCPHIFVSSVEIADVVPVEIQAIGDTSMCNFSVPLSSFATGGFGPLTYAWNNGGGFGSKIFVNPRWTTTYTVSVSDSCQSSTARDSLVVEIDCEYLFHIPNGFTPNNDGLNDIFNAKWKGMKTYNLKIYNRWGDILYTTDDPRAGWDGTGNDGEKMSEQEVYVYIFETTDFLDIPHYYVGKVTIIQ